MPRRALKNLWNLGSWATANTQKTVVLKKPKKHIHADKENQCVHNISIVQ
jgi:hypothetical protein